VVDIAPAVAEPKPGGSRSSPSPKGRLGAVGAAGHARPPKRSAWSTKAPNEVTFDGVGPRRSVSRRGSEEPPPSAAPRRHAAEATVPPRPTHIRRAATPAGTSDRSLPRPEISSSVGHMRQAETSRDRWTTLRRPYARDRSSPLTGGGPDGRAGEPTRTTSDAAPRPLPQLVATGRSPKLILRQTRSSTPTRRRSVEATKHPTRTRPRSVHGMRRCPELSIPFSA
jgi:hypothetical protein